MINIGKNKKYICTTNALKLRLLAKYIEIDKHKLDHCTKRIIYNLYV